MNVRHATAADLSEVVEMRHRLHSDADQQELADELPALIADPQAYAVLVAENEAGRLVGFAEVGRRNYVEGAPGEAAFLEAIYVEADQRRTGIARALVEAAEQWARGLGFGHLGSDALLDNLDSHAWHRAAGFEEVERTVVFVKQLG